MQQNVQTPVKLNIPTNQIVPDILPKLKKPLFVHTACSLRGSFEPDKFRHIDQGCAVTSYSSQSLTVDRVLVNADANESDLLLNQRMGYVAISRASEEAMIFTNSGNQVRAALEKSVDKEMAVEGLRQSSARDTLSREEWERLVRPTNKEAIAEQTFDQRLMSNSGEDNRGDQPAAGEEIELEINS